MTTQQIVNTFEEFKQKQFELIERKGNDYSNNEDRLANFKKSAFILNMSPEMQCLSLISTKVARLGELLSSGKIPQNEAIRDSVIDLANYSFLLECLIIENEKK